MRYIELLTARETFLLLFVGLVLVDHSVLGDHVLWYLKMGSPAVFLSWRRIWV